MSKKGNLSINSENIFPIIKKWLYSDHDIFVRELVSNACDAITKLKKLSLIGEFEDKGSDYKVKIEVSPKNKTIKFIDNGLGMTEQEIDEYINQIAFSGAKDFLEKYKDKTNEDQIIGHFGLGFYSAFMVADKVSIETLSYKNGEKAVYWESVGGTDFEMKDSDKESRGTTITLYLNEDSYQFANEYRVKEVLDKYCSFMPVEIYLEDIDSEATQIIEEKELKDSDMVIETILEDKPEDNKKEAEKEDKKDENSADETESVNKEQVTKYKIRKRPVLINETQPLWAKHPNECSEEDYKSFYRKVFNDYKEPLFWIHLNMDYPFNLKGILYFPKINTEYDSIEGTIKLYNNQVFIADNIKEVIPEFLMLLKGVIDCPDLPLNVSRSALQNDGFVKKISDYISKKVADKLTGMCKTDRENYEKYWDDIAPFIKFGCLKDEKFADKVNDYILFKNLADKYLTFKDLLEDAESKEENVKENEKDEVKDAGEENKDKEPKRIIYVTDVKEQGQYINLYKEAGKEAVILPHNIDKPFISQLEMKNKGIRFVRIDSELASDMKEEAVSEDLKLKYEETEKRVASLLNETGLSIKLEKLKNDSIAGMIVVSEESRRMQDMMKQYGMLGLGGMQDGEEKTLVLNANNNLVAKILEGNADNEELICKQVYDLACLSHEGLSPERMTEFIKRSNEIMLKL